MTLTGGDSGAAGRLDRSAQRYLAALLSGDRDGAIVVVAEALAAGESRAVVYAEVVSRAMAAVGRLWAVGEIDVADEQMASEITAAALLETAPAPVPPATPDALAVVACVAPELHGLGGQAVATVLRAAGWRVVHLRPGTPGNAVVRYAALEAPRVVALSVKAPERIAAALEVAARLKASPSPPQVLLGGTPLRGAAGGDHPAVDLATDDLAAAVSWLDGALPRAVAGD